jgi:uncharacterized protein (DUF362 family)
MPVSIASAADACYPEPGDFFSPAQRHPEYAFDHLSARPNPAYELVRRCLAQLGLDKERLDTPDWNPLRDYVAPGSSVFILCNFVHHRRTRESREAFFAKCIHGSVLRAVCDYALLAVGPEGSVGVGNAAVQSCRFEAVLAETGAAHALDFYRDRGAPVAVRDLRSFVSDRSALGRVRSARDVGASEDSVEIDLGADSLLREVAGSDEHPARFRIADYQPASIEAFHSGGTHRYRIHHAILDSDVVIHLSKLKTHEKVGVTCGLKGCVGAVTHKDCLAHYRFGSPALGGDEYPAALRFLHPVSWLHDRVNARGPRGPFQGPLQVLDRGARAILRRVGARTGGGWSGNDTAWRMALDLARILHYADTGGRMQREIQRTHLSLVDGIIGGEGAGPLSPDPVRSGAVLFADQLASGDRVACRLMGFDPDAFPLVREASRSARYPLGPRAVPVEEIRFDGASIGEEQVPAVASRAFRPPAGWRGALVPS